MSRETPTEDELYGVGAESDDDSASSMPSARVKATVSGVDCPHCDSYIMGFVGDPRGETIECEDCGKSFVIENDVDLS